MAIELLLVVVIFIGVFFSFKLRGAALKNALKLYLTGTILILGGCLGSVGWLDAETSGNSNLFTAVNPFIWAGMVIVGFVVLVYNAVKIINRRMQAGTNRNKDV